MFLQRESTSTQTYSSSSFLWLSLIPYSNFISTTTLSSSMVSFIPNFHSLFSPFLLHSYFPSPYPPMAMNTNNTLCLVSTMDRLWYHQIILCSDPFTSHFPNLLNSTSSLPFTNFVPSSPLSPLMDQKILPSSSSSSSSDNISLVSQEDYSNEEDKNKKAERESSEDQSLNNLKFSVGRKLNKCRSCRSLGELELEEVKGFMDLGFEFKRESLSPQMVKLVPGLQRLITQINKQNLEDDDDGDGDNSEENDDDDDDDDDDDKKREIVRPYLSEAWIVKRPNSPLLNLRMPKVSSTSDMKKHLRSWAKTVAFEIQ